MAGPSSPPIQFSGRDAGMLVNPSGQPPGSVAVTPGDTTLGDAIAANPAGTTFWLPAGTYTLGSSIFGQVAAKANQTFVGAGPATIISGQNVNRYAFTGAATGVTLRFLTVRDFNCPQDEGVVNHDSATGFTVDHCTITRNSGAGVFIGDGGVVRYSLLTMNGQYGFQNFGTDTLIEWCEISHNNTNDHEQRFYGCGCTGGGKFWDAEDSEVANCWIHSNLSIGLWADTNDVGFHVHDCYINDNNAMGIMYEISYNFLFENNTLARNCIVGGLLNPFFPNAAIYISESGGDSRVFGGLWATSRIRGNTFVDNINDVALYENPDRFYNSPANTSGQFYAPKGGVASIANCNNPSVTSNSTCSTTNGSTLVTTATDFFFDAANSPDDLRAISGPGIPVGTVVANVLSARRADLSNPATATASGVTLSMAAGTIDEAPAYDDCRWKTQNVVIEDNDFELVKSRIPALAAAPSNYAIGMNALISGFGTYPSWSPYQGETVSTAITFDQGNVWQNNRYVGDREWMAFDAATRLTYAQWRAAPYNQDAGSTFTP